MSDAAGQVPDRLHLLRQAELLLQLALLGHIPADADQSHHRTRAVAQGDLDGQAPLAIACGVHTRLLPIDYGLPAKDCEIIRVVKVGQLARVEVEDGLASEFLFARAAHQQAHRRVGYDKAPRGVFCEDDVGQRVDERPRRVALGRQRRLCFHAIRYIA